LISLISTLGDLFFLNVLFPSFPSLSTFNF
jgi:hypothetical protein